MLLSSGSELLTRSASLQSLEHDRVSPFAQQHDFVFPLHHHGHPLPYIVEVQNTKQVVNLFLPHHRYRYAVRTPLFENELEVTSG
jgi:hypothetical protein